MCDQPKHWCHYSLWSTAMDDKMRKYAALEEIARVVLNSPAPVKWDY